MSFVSRSENCNCSVFWSLYTACLLWNTELDVFYFWWKVNNEITSYGFQGFTSPGSLFLLAYSFLCFICNVI